MGRKRRNFTRERVIFLKKIKLYIYKKKLRWFSEIPFLCDILKVNILF